ncbi:MAG: hypothetical protein JST00_15070 [Deltaproteobacteria bacterium]|nr:hypothetical protein [Deltaproteobacteria bacterium]
MLVIGSRALHHSFPHLRACVDWDLVGTAEERERLAERIEPLRGRPWTPKKGYFLLGDRPVEYIVADHSDWMDVLARPALRGNVPGIGEIAFASPETLLLLKLSHVHVTGHFWKTASDLHLLRKRASLQPGDDDLLDRMRLGAERRRGAEACGFGPRMRALPDAASPATAMQRRARIARMAPTLARHLEPSRPDRLAAVPRPADAARVLSEIAMVWALEEDLVSAAQLASPRTCESAMRHVIETLCTDVFGRDLRIAVNAFASDALALVPKGFASAPDAIASTSARSLNESSLLALLGNPMEEGLTCAFRRC